MIDFERIILDWYGYSGRREIQILAFYEVRVEPAVEYSLHSLELTQDDKQSIKEEPRFVPKPKTQAPVTFSLSTEHELMYKKYILIIM